MNVLIITGKLAKNVVKNVSSRSKQNVFVHVVNTPIAAFLTPKKIIEELNSQKDFDLKSIDTLIVPGLIKKDVNYIKEKTGIPSYKGPTDAADLDIVLDLLEDLELSSKISADKLIEEEQRKKALKIIYDFENDESLIKKLLKKEENILVGSLPVGEDFPMRVLSEIANAPLLSPESLVKRAKYFVKSGADMIDLGMMAGENLSHKIPEMVALIRKYLGNIPLSIDSLNPAEIEVALESGVDMVLSLDHGNYEELLPLLQEKNVPAVILPTDYQQGWVPETISERVNSLIKLKNKCANIEVIADLILDPINSQSIVDSILASQQFYKNNKCPLFFGIGNVTELLDTDSVGVNALLSGIAMELGASILFTPEESGKTRGSVYELAVSSKMMFLAKKRSSVPKDLGINLVYFKDKRQGEKVQEELEVPVIKTTETKKFIQDPAGSFKIMIEDDEIKVVHYLNWKPTLALKGEKAKILYENILKLNLVSQLEHAAYLGSELQKAEIAIKTGKTYTQDFELFKKPFKLI